MIPKNISLTKSNAGTRFPESEIHEAVSILVSGTDCFGDEQIVALSTDLTELGLSLTNKIHIFSVQSVSSTLDASTPDTTKIKSTYFTSYLANYMGNFKARYQAPTPSPSTESPSITFFKLFILTLTLKTHEILENLNNHTSVDKTTSQAWIKECKDAIQTFAIDALVKFVKMEEEEAIEYLATSTEEILEKSQSFQPLSDETLSTGPPVKNVSFGRLSVNVEDQTTSSTHAFSGSPLPTTPGANVIDGDEFVGALLAQLAIGSTHTISQLQEFLKQYNTSSTTKITYSSFNIQDTIKSIETDGFHKHKLVMSYFKTLMNQDSIDRSSTQQLVLSAHLNLIKYIQHSINSIDLANSQQLHEKVQEPLVALYNELIKHPSYLASILPPFFGALNALLEKVSHKPGPEDFTCIAASYFSGEDSFLSQALSRTSTQTWTDLASSHSFFQEELHQNLLQTVIFTPSNITDVNSTSPPEKLYSELFLLRYYFKPAIFNSTIASIDAISEPTLKDSFVKVLRLNISFYFENYFPYQTIILDSSGKVVGNTTFKTSLESALNDEKVKQLLSPDYTQECLDKIPRSRSNSNPGNPPLEIPS